MVMLTDRLNMTIAVDWNVQPQIEQTKIQYNLDINIFYLIFKDHLLLTQNTNNLRENSLNENAYSNFYVGL